MIGSQRPDEYLLPRAAVAMSSYELDLQCKRPTAPYLHLGSIGLELYEIADSIRASRTNGSFGFDELRDWMDVEVEALQLSRVCTISIPFVC